MATWVKSVLKAPDHKASNDYIVTNFTKNGSSVETNLDIGYFFRGPFLVPFFPERTQGLLDRLSKLILCHTNLPKTAVRLLVILTLLKVLMVQLQDIVTETNNIWKVSNDIILD